MIDGKQVESATETEEGVVELAADGEVAAGKVVQGNDSRLSAASQSSEFFLPFGLDTVGFGVTSYLVRESAGTIEESGFTLPFPAIVSGLRIKCESNTMDGATVVTVRDIDGAADTAQTVTIPAGSTALAETVAAAVNLTENKRLAIKIDTTASTVGTITVARASVIFQKDDTPNIGNGVWTQLAKGPTTVANNTQTVLASTTLSAGEILVPFISVKSNFDMVIFNDDTAPSPPSGVSNWDVTKNSGGTTDFRVIHRETPPVSADFDWVLYKVTPA